MNIDPPAAAPAVRNPRAVLLRRRKAIAVGLLLAAGAGLALVSWAQVYRSHWSLELLAAVFEAALVGGLADWFAVVALFRHPLGQRWIPHTAIIPSKKDALGASLADFLCDHFLGTRQVADKLRSIDMAGALADKLAGQEFSDKLGAAVARALPRILDALDSEALHRFLYRIADARLREVDLSGVVAVVLRQLTADGRHQALVDSALAWVGDMLERPGTHAQVSQMAASELWKVLRYLKLEGVVADKLADRLVAGMASLVSTMAEDREHELRARVGLEFQRLIQRLEDDPDLRTRVNGFRDQLLAESDLSQYLRGLWRNLAEWVRDDTSRDDSQVTARMAGAAREIGGHLAADATMRQWINEGIVGMVLPEIERYREAIRGFIIERVRQWSAAELTNELELAVGSDLQFIRYNGTAVGALIGGVLYGIVRAIHHFG